MHIGQLQVADTFEVAQTRLIRDEIRSGIEADPFELRLDRLGFWPKSQVLWLGASTEPLGGLAAGLH